MNMTSEMVGQAIERVRHIQGQLDEDRRAHREAKYAETAGKLPLGLQQSQMASIARQQSLIAEGLRRQRLVKPGPHTRYADPEALGRFESASAVLAKMERGGASVSLSSDGEKLIVDWCGRRQTVEWGDVEPLVPEIANILLDRYNRMTRCARQTTASMLQAVGG